MISARPSASLSLDELWFIYERLNVELADLGGSLGNEETADYLLEEIEHVIRVMSLQQAKSPNELARKLRIAIAFLDEAANPIARDVIASVANDLDELK